MIRYLFSYLIHLFPSFPSLVVCLYLKYASLHYIRVFNTFSNSLLVSIFLLLVPARSLCYSFVNYSNAVICLITWQSNLRISQFNRPCNEFTSVRSMFVYNKYSSPPLSFPCSQTYYCQQMFDSNFNCASYTVSFFHRIREPAFVWSRYPFTNAIKAMTDVRESRASKLIVCMITK